MITRNSSGLGVLIMLFISTFSNAGYQYLLDQSPVFSDDALEVNICFGDVNNDGVIDMVIGKHKDFKTGRTAAFQQTQTGWDTGTEIYQGGNGNMHPLVGYINGSNRLIINRHDQGNYGGNLQFLKFDSDFEINSSYNIPLNNPYFSDQVLIGETVYFNTRGKLGKAEWDDLTLTFTSTALANNGEGNKLTAIAAEDLTGDGVQDIIYWTYDFSKRGLSVLTNNTEVVIEYGDTVYFTTGQFDASTDVPEILYANNADDTLTLVSYNQATNTFVPQVILTQQEETVYTVAAFDINGDGTDEALFATPAGEIFEFNLVTQQLKTVLTSDVYWYDSVVADWGEGPRAVFVGSKNGDISVVSFARDTAVIDDITGKAYLLGKQVEIHWVFNAIATMLDVQVRNTSDEIWTTILTVPSIDNACQLSGLPEGEYDLRLADANNNHVVYGQTGTFYVYTCNQSLAGDLSEDCYVDLEDFSLFASNYTDLSGLAQIALDWLCCDNPYDETCNQ